MGDPADQAGIYDEKPRERFRVTIRPVVDGTVGPLGSVELRGYVDGFDQLAELADTLKSMGLWVIASEADSDYDPFTVWSQ